MQYIEVRLNENLSLKQTIRENLEFVAETEKEVVVKDKIHFKILDKEKVKKNYTQFNFVLNCPSVSDYFNDKFFKDCWGAFVIRLYTNLEDEKTINRILTKTFNKFLDEKRSKYSYLFSGQSVEIKI